MQWEICITGGKGKAFESKEEPFIHYGGVEGNAQFN